MKVFIGALAAIIVLTGATLTLFSMWDIYPISWVFVLKAGLTVAVFCVTILLLWLIKTIFFQKDIFNRHKEK